MTQKEFEKFLDEHMKNLSLEKQEQLLRKIQDKWLPRIEAKFQKKVSMKYTKCFECGSYSLSKDFKTTVKEEEVKNQTVFVDAGYGDDDKIADVTYQVHYSVCPKCKASKELYRLFLYEKNRRKCK